MFRNSECQEFRDKLNSPHVQIYTHVRARTHPLPCKFVSFNGTDEFATRWGCQWSHRYCKQTWIFFQLLIYLYASRGLKVWNASNCFRDIQFYNVYSQIHYRNHIQDWKPENMSENMSECGTSYKHSTSTWFRSVTYLFLILQKMLAGRKSSEKKKHLEVLLSVTEDNTKSRQHCNI